MVKKTMNRRKTKCNNSDEGISHRENLVPGNDEASSGRSTRVSAQVGSNKQSTSFSKPLVQQNTKKKQKTQSDSREKNTHCSQPEENWNRRLQQLVAFRKAHGHIRVPKYSNKLHGWICTQRANWSLFERGRTTLSFFTGEQITKLRSIGMQSPTRRNKKQTHGSTDSGGNGVEYNDPPGGGGDNEEKVESNATRDCDDGKVRDGADHIVCHGDATSLGEVRDTSPSRASDDGGCNDGGDGDYIIAPGGSGDDEGGVENDDNKDGNDHIVRHSDFTSHDEGRDTYPNRGSYLNPFPVEEIPLRFGAMYDFPKHTGGFDDDEDFPDDVTRVLDNWYIFSQEPEPAFLELPVHTLDFSSREYKEAMLFGWIVPVSRQYDVVANNIIVEQSSSAVQQEHHDKKESPMNVICSKPSVSKELKQSTAHSRLQGKHNQQQKQRKQRPSKQKLQKQQTQSYNSFTVTSNIPLPHLFIALPCRRLQSCSLNRSVEGRGYWVWYYNESEVKGTVLYRLRAPHPSKQEPLYNKVARPLLATVSNLVDFVFCHHNQKANELTQKTVQEIHQVTKEEVISALQADKNDSAVRVNEDKEIFNLQLVVYVRRPLLRHLELAHPALTLGDPLNSRELPSPFLKSLQESPQGMLPDTKQPEDLLEKTRRCEARSHQTAWGEKLFSFFESDSTKVRDNHINWDEPTGSIYNLDFCSALKASQLQSTLYCSGIPQVARIGGGKVGDGPDNDHDVNDWELKGLQDIMTSLTCDEVGADGHSKEDVNLDHVLRRHRLARYRKDYNTNYLVAGNLQS